MSAPHSPIAERAKILLGDRRLNRVVDSRLEAGVKTYGQTIDAWPGTPRRAAMMRLQELLDSINYALFEGDTMGAQADAAQVRRILGRYPDMTVEEMIEREPEVQSDQPDVTLEEKAALWDGLMNAGRLRVIGWAGLEEGDTGSPHIGLEMWRIYPGITAADNARDRQLITLFAQTASEASV